MINVVLHSPGVYTAVLDVCVNLVSRTVDFFKPGNVNYMKNIFLHESGHVLGLRHEFAPEKEGDTVQIGPRQKGSVMDYEFPPAILKSDVESTRLLS